jgi:hypothetical protein
LLQSEKSAEYILAKAGVTVIWRDCMGDAGQSGSRMSPVAPAEFWLRLAIWKPSVASGEAMGFTALDRDPGDDGMAGIYCPMVKSMAVGLTVEDSAIPGPAIAHDIGHLLGAGHGSTSVMCAHFGRMQVVQGRAGGLPFSVAEAAQIRADIARHEAAVNAASLRGRLGNRPAVLQSASQPK